MIRFIRKFLIAILVLILSENTIAQNSFQYPTPLSQFFNYYAFVNPASTGMENKFAIRVGEQMNAGYYSRIKTFFALSELSLKTKNKESHHALGIAFMNKKEGSLLSFNRVYLQYAYHLAISGEWKIASGISAGFLNLSIDQSNASKGVSSYAPDGSFGFWLYRDKERIGFSSAQILNTSIQVIYERIPIQRYYTFFYSRSFKLSPNAKIIPAIVYVSKKEGPDIDVNTNVLLQDLILFGVSYRYPRGSAYFFGVRDLKFMGGLTDFTVSYNAPWPTSNLGNIQTFELILSYKLN